MISSFVTTFVVGGDVGLDGRGVSDGSRGLAPPAASRATCDDVSVLPSGWASLMDGRLRKKSNSPMLPPQLERSTADAPSERTKPTHHNSPRSHAIAVTRTASS